MDNEHRVIAAKREANFFFKELMNDTEKVLKSGMYINGDSVKQFENSVSEYLKVKYTISVGNGSDALTFILRAIGVSQVDEVICPANSFIAALLRGTPNIFRGASSLHRE